MFAATEPNSSMQSNDPLLVPGSPASPRGYLGPRGSADAHSSSSAEDVQDFVPMVSECLGQASKSKQPRLVQHFSDSLTRAFRKSRNRKSLDITSKCNPNLSRSRTRLVQCWLQKSATTYFVASKKLLVDCKLNLN